MSRWEKAYRTYNKVSWCIFFAFWVILFTVMAINGGR